MSREFLDRLLSTKENHVHSDQDADCIICLEKYNTLNISTGTVELEIRLPCGHRMGSSCIVTWLKAHNNCPACRATFFPAQPRPYLVHGIMDGGTPRRTAPLRVSAPTRLVGPLLSLIDNLCSAFVDFTLDFRVVSTASSIGRHLIYSLQDQSQTQLSIAATSIYMASHLVRRPKTLTEISQVVGVRLDEIRHLYRQAYPNRMQLIDPVDVVCLARGYIEGMLAFLPPPNRGVVVIDNDEERGNLQDGDVRPTRHQYADMEPFFRHLVRVSGADVSSISSEIASEILRERSLDLRSLALVAEISWYIGMHLLGLRSSSPQFTNLEGALGTAYARVYHLRRRIIKPNILTHIALANLPRAVQALPPLDWPPL